MRAFPSHTYDVPASIPELGLLSGFHMFSQYVRSIFLAFGTAALYHINRVRSGDPKLRPLCYPAITPYSRRNKNFASHLATISNHTDAYQKPS